MLSDEQAEKNKKFKACPSIHDHTLVNYSSQSFMLMENSSCLF